MTSIMSKQLEPLKRLFAHPVRLVIVASLTLALGACGPASRILSPASDIQECVSALVAAPMASGVFVEPDDGREPILEEIQAARCSVDVSVYLLTDKAVIGELIAASARSVRVRVLLEEHPFGGGGGQYDVESELEEGGVDVKWSGSEVRFSHAKYVVVDRQIALILNQNLTNASFEGNREFGSVTTDPAAAMHAQEIFDADWEGKPVEEIDGPLMVSPTTSRRHYLALIGEAEAGIDFYAEVIRDPQIIAALGSAEARGVDVRLILNDALDEDDQDISAQLHAVGVEIRLASGLYIHAKAMVVDAQIVIVGSQNFTATSLDQNRELAIVLDDPLLVSRCMDVFERDWIRSSPAARPGE